MSLVGVGDAEETDARLVGRHRLEHLLGLLAIGINGHQEQLVRMIMQDGLNGLDELVTAAGEGRDNHRHILGRQFWIGRGRNGLEGPERDQVHHQADITVQAEQMVSLCASQHILSRYWGKHRDGTRLLTREQRISASTLQTLFRRVGHWATF